MNNNFPRSSNKRVLLTLIKLENSLFNIKSKSFQFLNLQMAYHKNYSKSNNNNNNLKRDYLLQNNNNCLNIVTLGNLNLIKLQRTSL